MLDHSEERGIREEIRYFVHTIEFCLVKIVKVCMCNSRKRYRQRRQVWYSLSTRDPCTVQTPPCIPLRPPLLPSLLPLRLPLASLVRASNWSNLDIRILYACRSRLNRSRDARVGRVSASRHTRRARTLRRRVYVIQPQHIGIVVVPKAHHEHHTLPQGSSHTRKAALLVKVIGVTKSRLLRIAERARDRVARDATDVRDGVGMTLPFCT